MPLLIPFAWSPSHQRLVEPIEVPSGTKAGCTCPSCKEVLLARHARRAGGPVSHFAHKPNSTCTAGLETVIHLAAKEIITRERRIWVPAVLAFPFYPDNMRPIRAAPAQVVEVERVESEVPIGPYRPDMLLHGAHGRRMAVEIVVTNPVSEEKEDFYEQQRISALVVDIGKRAKKMTLAGLRQLLLEGDRETDWLHNEFAEQLTKKFQTTAIARQITWRKSEKRGANVPHVDGCPCPPRQHASSASTFANARLDCPGCAYHWKGANDRRLTAIWCAGHMAARYPEPDAVDWLPDVPGRDDQ